ncbi:MAG: MerR family transcriptional regulator [Solirubrobacterales bacterium]|nr:MerR family transcriptional regulator [Solirubrobacterales bacterium]
MDGLTINQAAETTGWSPRMLRYLDGSGLVSPSRTGAGYRIYGPGELQRLRTLRELLDTQGLEISDVGFAQRMRSEPELQTAVESWFDAPVAPPEGVAGTADWLRFEQSKHERLLQLAGETR